MSAPEQSFKSTIPVLNLDLKGRRGEWTPLHPAEPDPQEAERIIGAASDRFQLLVRCLLIKHKNHPTAVSEILPAGFNETSIQLSHTRMMERLAKTPGLPQYRLCKKTENGVTQYQLWVVQVGSTS